MFNPAAQHPDPIVRRAFDEVFRALVGPKEFSSFRLEEIRDTATGHRVMVIRSKASGKWSTVAAVDDSGTVFGTGFTPVTSGGFASKGWDKSE
jgi:hypothetical protein